MMEDPPDGTGWLYDLTLALRKRTSAGFDANPIDPTMVKTYMEIMRMELLPLEIEIIFAFDDGLRAGKQKGEK